MATNSTLFCSGKMMDCKEILGGHNFPPRPIRHFRIQRKKGTIRCYMCNTRLRGPTRPTVKMDANLDASGMGLFCAMPLLEAAYPLGSRTEILHDVTILDGV